MPETTIELLPPDSAEAEAEDAPAPTEAVEQSPEEPPAARAQPRADARSLAAPKKRGRPAGAKNKAKPPTTVSTPPVAPVAAVVAEPPEIELPPPAPKAKAKTKAKPKPKARSEPVQYESESEEEPTPRTARRNAWSAFREHQAFEHAARRDAFERRISMFMN